MIKLNRGECPKELTDEVKEELTELYKKDKEKDVWNSPKIKKTLKRKQCMLCGTGRLKNTRCNSGKKCLVKVIH